MVVLYTDGASKNNPGQAGIGYVLYKKNQIIKEGCYKLPITTNNIAEICAIIIALHECYPLIFKEKLVLKSDSLLLVNQFNNKYKIKNILLIQAHRIFQKYYGNLDITFEHISRNLNTYADMLANKGLHENISLPIEIANVISSLFPQHCSVE